MLNELYTSSGEQAVLLESGDPAIGSASAPYLGVGAAPGVTGSLGGMVDLTLEGADNAVRADIGRGGTGTFGDSYGPNGDLRIRDLAATPGNGHTSGEMLVVGSDGDVGRIISYDTLNSIDSGSGSAANIGLDGGFGSIDISQGGRMGVFAPDARAHVGAAFAADGWLTGGVVHSFSALFKASKRSLVAASSLGKWAGRGRRGAAWR